VLDGRCSGSVLENLHVAGEVGDKHYGLSIEPMPVEQGAESILVRNCRIEEISIGLRIFGLDNQFEPDLTGGVIVADNQFVNTLQALRVEGLVRNVAIVGNIFDHAQMCGIQLQDSVDETENILIANNTLVNCGRSMSVWQTTPRGRSIRFINNLSLGFSDSDWFFMASDGNAEVGDPGDGPAVLDVYQFSHNWREDNVDDADIDGWIPLGETDRRVGDIQLLSRSPRSDDFLRPAADSPLANGGLGADGLPAYVGAVPPEGTERWEWSLPTDAEE
jgi:hypothetical protein